MNISHTELYPNRTKNAENRENFLLYLYVKHEFHCHDFHQTQIVQRRYVEIHNEFYLTRLGNVASMGTN